MPQRHPSLEDIEVLKHLCDNFFILYASMNFCGSPSLIKCTHVTHWANRFDTTVLLESLLAMHSRFSTAQNFLSIVKNRSVNSHWRGFWSWLRPPIHDLIVLSNSVYNSERVLLRIVQTDTHTQTSVLHAWGLNRFNKIYRWFFPLGSNSYTENRFYAGFHLWRFTNGKAAHLLLLPHGV